MKIRHGLSLFILAFAFLVSSCPNGNIRSLLNDFRPYAEGTYDIPQIKLNPGIGGFTITCGARTVDHWMRVYSPTNEVICSTIIQAGTALIDENRNTAALTPLTTYRIVFTSIYLNTTLEGRPQEYSVTPGAVFVDLSRTTDGGGSCWGDARNNLVSAGEQADFMAFGANSQVRVASGTFPAAAFTFGFNITNVSLIGGCAKTPTLSEVGRTSFQAPEGNTLGSIFYFSGTNSDTEIRNFEFHDANGTSPGAGIRYQNIKNTIFRNCLFEGNSTTEPGGGLYVATTTGSFVVQDCQFYRNTGHNGGAIYIIGSSDSMVYENCIFEENQVPSDHNGGALQIMGGRTNIEVKKSVFANNIAGYGGGAIVCDQIELTPVLILSNSVFFNNYADNGRHIYINGTGSSCYTVRAVFCTFSSAGQSDSGYSVFFEGNGVPHVFAGCLFSTDNANNYLVRNSGSGTNYFSYCLSDRPLQAPYFIFPSGTNTYQLSLSIEIPTPILANRTSPMGTDKSWMTPDDGLRLGQILDSQNLIDSIPASVTINGSEFHFDAYTTDITGRTRPYSTNSGTAYADVGAYEYYPY